MPPPISRNARLAAVSLGIGGLSQMGAALHGMLALPWAFGGWLVFCFGALALSEELGPNKPLNRAGLILLAAAFSARCALVIVPAGEAASRAEWAYILAILGATQFWSVALMHRKGQIRGFGVAGTTLSGGALALLFFAHLALGGVSFAGLAGLAAMIKHGDARLAAAVIGSNVVLALWSVFVGGMLLRAGLNEAADYSAPAISR